ncbi:MAG: Ig-like domain repeat protein, partial [Rhizobacter sp.]
MKKNLNASHGLRTALWALALGFLGLVAGPAHAVTATTTTLTSGLNPSVVGQSVTLSATISAPAATGTVTFKDGSTTLGTAALSGGVASLSTSFASVAGHNLSAIYGGDAAYTASTSATLSQTVGKANTATALTSNLNPGTAGQNITLSANVTVPDTGAAPSGTVTFKDGATTLGTGTLSAGVASFTTKFNAAGPHSLSAVYAGSTIHNASTSSAFSQTVDQAPSASALTATPAPSVAGQAVTLKATVTGAVPGGPVSFFDGSTSLGSASLSATTPYVASLTVPFALTGAHSLTVAYAGDTNNTASTSTALSQTVNKTNTTTVLAASPNPAGVNQSVTFNATVSGAAPGGSVTFKDGSTVLGSVALSGNVASFATAFATSGAHSITAAYAGDSNNNASTSGALSETVNKLATTTVLSAPATIAAGAAVVLSAAVTPAAATGTITFKDGSTTLGSGAVNAGTATVSITFTTAGTHSLTAVYSSDTTYAASTSGAVSQPVGKADTTATLSATPSPSAAAQSVSLKAIVTGVSPGGSVTFMDGATTLGSANLSGTATSATATFATPFAAAGTHNLSAIYAGNANNNSSTSNTLSQSVNPASSSTSLSVTPNPVTVNQTVTLKATVTGAAPSGSVAFMDGGTALGSATLVSGIATLATSLSVSGAHSITAAYGGDANNALSTSSAANLTVNKIVTTSTLTSAFNPGLVGQGVTLTSTVSPSNATGTVTFKDGAATLGTGTLIAGSASFNATFATSGTHSLTAVYAGDSLNGTSTSGSVNEVVNKVASTATLAAAPNPSVVSQSVTLSATVSPATASGTVTFKDGSYTLGTASLSGGTASFTGSFSSTGGHNLTALYGGDTTYASSTSAALSQTVQAATTTTVLTATPSPAPAGGSVTLKATVTGVSPGGSVTFMDDTTPLGTATIFSGGIASLSVPFATTGTHNLTAIYSGNASNNTSTSSVLGFIVTKAGPGITLSATGSSTVNQPSSLTATVTGATPTGTITFLDGATTLGTANLSATSPYTASLPTTFTTTGWHTLKAVYSGDGNNTTTFTTTSRSISALNTTTALAVSPNPAAVNQSVTLNVTVSPPGVTGIVALYDNGTVVSSTSLVNGTATYTTSYTTQGSHSLRAWYEGDATTNSSSSAYITLPVNPNPTATTLTTSPNPAAAGQTVTLTAGITPATATGSVTFQDGGTTLGTASLNGGVATFSTTFALAGSHSLTAQYAGNGGYSASTSAPLSQDIGMSASATVLSATPNPAVMGQGVTLTASVSGNAPSGSVTFRDGATVLGTVALNAGMASLATSFSSAGPHSLSASYGGDSGNAASSAVLTQLVDSTPPPLPPVPVSAAPVVNYEYDAQGHLTRTVRAPGSLNLATQASYDPLYRVQDSTDPQLGVTRFRYDGQDRTTQVTDPRNLVTQSPRDGLGQVTQLISPDTGTATPTYDAAGNVLTRTDSRGALAVNTYDALNRLTQSVFTLGAQTQTFGWGHDQSGPGFAFGGGRLTSTSHPSGGSRYAYDAEGHLASETQTVAAAAGANGSDIVLSVGYGYDDAGHLSTLTYPSGRQLRIAYDQGQPTGMSLVPNSNGTPVSLISRLGFAPFGEPELWHWQLASGLTQANPKVYDTTGRMVRYRLGASFRDVGYDAADRISSYTQYDATTGAAQPNLDQSFGYDGNGRLTSVTTATANWTIGYDANGNRTSVTLSGTPSTYTTEATSNKLTGITNPARSFGYDSAGNTTSDSAGYTATYDASGRLATITKAGVITSYAYNNNGQRVRKFSSTGASSTTVFVYGLSGELIGEYDSTGKALREYVWLGATPIAMFTPDPVNAANPPLAYYLHTDHLNTPRLVTDTANNIRWRWMAEPFGTTAPENNPAGLGVFTQPLRFPGQYADAESGLYYNHHRYYDPVRGRYVESDPIGMDGGINTYAYVGGNPLSRIDPT